MLKKKIRTEIEKAIKERAKAKAQIKDLEGLVERCNDYLLPTFIANDIAEYTVDGVGKAAIRESKGMSLSQAKIREHLLLSGWTIKKIECLIAKCSTTWRKEYIDVRAK